MSTVAFDTLKFATKLEQGGFTRDQAECLTAVLADALSGSSSDDIGAKRNDIAVTRINKVSRANSEDSLFKYIPNWMIRILPSKENRAFISTIVLLQIYFCVTLSILLYALMR